MKLIRIDVTVKWPDGRARAKRAALRYGPLMDEQPEGSEVVRQEVIHLSRMPDWSYTFYAKN